MTALTGKNQRAAFGTLENFGDAGRGHQHELLQLPYYGVFDFLSFKYDKGTVDLMGYHLWLKNLDGARSPARRG